jgi:hypothetical protein
VKKDPQQGLQARVTHGSGRNRVSNHFEKDLP